MADAKIPMTPRGAQRLKEERGMSDDELKRISGKQLIEEFGVEAFNQLCRESVWKYKDGRIELEPFRRLAVATMRALREEAKELAAMHA